jgi:integrase/recombinase XerD
MRKPTNRRRHPAAPAGCFWRGDTLWGRKRVKGRAIAWSLHTDNPKVARERFAAGEKRIVADTYHGDGRRTLAEVVEAWANHITHAVSPKTATRYLCSLEQIGGYLDGKGLADVTPQLIAEIVRQRQADGVTVATIKRDLVALSSVMNYAMDEGWAESNPVLARLSRLKERRDPIVLPSDKDIALVLDHAPGMMVDLISVARATGAREDELVHARRDAIDHERRQFTIVKGKRGKLRVIDLELFGGYELVRGLATYARSPWLFWHDDGRDYRNFASNFRAVMRNCIRFAEQTGIEFTPFRFHDLRHRHAVDWLKAGRSIYDLQHRLGHSSIKVTEIYLQYLTAEERNATMRGARAMDSNGKVATKLATVSGLTTPEYKLSD